MKKVITFFLALVLILSVVPAAHADELDDFLASLSQRMAESETNLEKYSVTRLDHIVYIDAAIWEADLVTDFAARGYKSYVAKWDAMREDAMGLAREMQTVLDDLESGMVCVVRITQLYAPDVVYLTVTSDAVLQDITAIAKPGGGLVTYFEDLVSSRNAEANAQIYSYRHCRSLFVLIRTEPGSHRLAWLSDGNMPGSDLLWNAMVEECRADLDTIDHDMIYISENVSVIYAVLDDSDGSLLLLLSNKNVIYDRVRGVDIFTGAFRNVS